MELQEPGKDPHRAATPEAKNEGRGIFITALLIYSLCTILSTTYDLLRLGSKYSFRYWILPGGWYDLFLISSQVVGIVTLAGILRWKKVGAKALLINYFVGLLVGITTILLTLFTLPNTADALALTFIVPGLVVFLVSTTPIILLWYWALRRKWFLFR